MADDHDGVVIGREMAAARDADARRLAGDPPPSSLPATRYDGARGDHRLYDPQRLPLDDELATCARRFRDMTDDARADTRAAMSLDDGYTLLAFARRAAVFALRSGDQAQVAEGLSACAAIELERVDQRDVLVALGLLHHAAHRCGADASEMLRSAAGLGGPGFSALVDGFLAGSRGEHDLRDSWGLCEVDGPAGIGLLRWGFAPWTPRHDLAGASLRVAEALRGDVYDVDDPELATKLPAVWLSDPGDRSAEEVLNASRGAAVIHARLRAEASVDHASQQLTAWLVELKDEYPRRTWSSSPGRRVSTRRWSVSPMVRSSCCSWHARSCRASPPMRTK